MPEIIENSVLQNANKNLLNRKIKIWQNRLLDLSKRNRMMSLRDSNSQALRLVEPDFETLYNKIVIKNKELTIKQPVTENDIYTYDIMRLMHFMSQDIKIAKGDILANGSFEKSLTTVKNIKKYADLYRQEKGTSVLYLCYGFVYWNEKEGSENWYKAPLILVPVNLTQDSISMPYKIKKTDEELMENPTFAFYLEMNYGIKLPKMTETDNFDAVEEYLNKVAAMVEKLGWRVQKEVYLSTMSSLKTNMYNDLIDNEERIAGHPIIRALAGEKNEYTTLNEQESFFAHDKKPSDSFFEVLNADSSQKDAIELSRKGISFIMQGPPGTGKSQTIANIISQAIADGKKVLFVSEKQAALDVVYKRLRDVGLGSLCLPLHDPKISKHMVLAELEKNLDTVWSETPNNELSELYEMDVLKENLSEYVEQVHVKIHPMNMSVYDAQEILFGLLDLPYVPLSMSDIRNKTQADMNRMMLEAAAYEKARDVLGDRLFFNPWAGIKRNNITYLRKQNIKAALIKLSSILKKFDDINISGKALSEYITIENKNKYLALGTYLARNPYIPEKYILGDAIPEDEALIKAVNSVKAVLFSNNNCVIDKAVLSAFLSENSNLLFECLDLLYLLEEHSEEVNTIVNSFDDYSSITGCSLCDLQDRLNRCIEKFDDIDEMIEYEISAEKCRKEGILSFLVSAYKERKENGTLSKIFEKSFINLWIESVFDENHAVSQFSSAMQEIRINRFSELDKKLLLVAKNRVIESAYKKMPSRSSGRVIGEMSVLLRELARPKKALSIRQLFDSIPKLLTTLKPCLMMSPLSVAYFLNADLYRFDIVIFDEASQIFPENAIGAIYRGKQVIIAGDSKQMPPTSFFRTIADIPDEEDVEEIENSDSILEEAENNLPNLSLTWHYRSKNESLISFSNERLYSGSLISFPDSKFGQKNLGVEFCYVEDGVYHDRCNTKEAEKCLELVIEHFKNNPGRSIGIIAFSSSQADEIERVFEEYRKNNTEYEMLFSPNREAPFFIKNLENVQGDERDTIILSIGYAKNIKGILRYNFGPLGMQGGDRRMNVAITRAKYNIKLVSSLVPDDFDEKKVERINGAKLLHDYINYAFENKEQRIYGNKASIDGFRDYICSVLKSAGYEFDLNVGNSGYKVEIAVKNPLNNKEYIAGIETDGDFYSRARTVRDRDNLRPEMLNSMGWNTYRAWSAQWSRDPDAEKEKLISFINELVKKYKNSEVNN